MRFFIGNEIDWLALFDFKPSLCAISNCATLLEVHDIFSLFYDFQKNPEKYRQIGLHSKKWFDENVGEGLIERYIDLIRLLSENRTATLEEGLVSYQV